MAPREFEWRSAPGAAVAAVALIAAGCVPPARVGMPHEVDMPAAGADPTGVVVLLPGIGDRAATFAREGFVGALRRAAPTVQIVSTNATLGYYMRGALVRRLHDDVVEPAFTGWHHPVWLVGISMGGLGAALFAREYPGLVAGVFLIAPFLGPDGLVEEIAAAGGLMRWTPAEPFDEYELLWTWLQGYGDPEVAPLLPRLYLGYGTSDRLGAAHRLLAAALPSDRVLTVPGEHDWPPWRALLDAFLGRVPLEA